MPTHRRSRSSMRRVTDTSRASTSFDPTCSERSSPSAPRKTAGRMMSNDEPMWICPHCGSSRLMHHWSELLQPFARDSGYGGSPFGWDVGQRALLRAQPGAYYARLYGLTRKQLRYILDPTEDPPDVPRTKDFPGETFRVLKEREMREYGEYRAKRLVLKAWDKLAQLPI